MTPDDADRKDSEQETQNIGAKMFCFHTFYLIYCILLFTWIVQFLIYLD